MGRGTRISIATFSACTVLGLVVVFAVSCEKAPAGAKYNTTNVRRLRTAYNIYSRLHDLKGPTSEQELKQFLKSDLTAKVRLGRIGIDVAEVDEIFTSERDGKPFKVRYGLNGSGDQAVVFEEEGVGGKRFIALWNPIEVDAKEYEQYWSGEKTPPANAAGIEND